MYKNIYPTYLLFLLFCFLLTTSCRDDEPKFPSDPEIFERTVLVYMAAQNSLGADERLKDDSLEIAEAVKSIGNKHCLLVYIDDAQNPRIYRFRNGLRKPQVVRRWREDRSSVDPEQLSDVLAWMSAHYPAQEYGLVLWSHATGWIPSTGKSIKSFGVDTGKNGLMYSDKDINGNPAPQMEIPDLAEAIRNSGVRLHYLMFDACLMQGLESCFALRNAANYIIGSPISIHAAGGYYTNLVKNGLFNADVVDIARTYYADICSPDLAATYNNYGIVISVVRCDALEQVAATLKQLLPYSKFTERSSPTVASATNYAAYSSHYDFRPHSYDALEIMRETLPVEQFEEWRRVLDSAVVYHTATPSFIIGPWSNNRQQVDVRNSIGVSMFVPQNIYSWNALQCPSGDLNEAFRKTEWYECAGWAATGW